MPMRSKKLLAHANTDLPDALAGLTDKRRKFAEKYALTHSQTKACRLAGLSEDYGYHLLEEPLVLQAIAYYEALYEAQSESSAEKLLHQWSQLAAVDVTSFLDDDYSLKPLSQLTPEQRQVLAGALVGIKVTHTAYGRNVEAKFARVEALDALSKIFGLYAKDEQHGDGLTLHINLGAAPDTPRHATIDLGAVSIQMGDDPAQEPQDAPRLPLGGGDDHQG